MRTAQREWESHLSELRSAAADPSLIAECGAQLGVLADLQMSMANATPATLAVVRACVTASMAASSAIAERVRVAATGTAALESAQIAAVTAATRRDIEALNADMFERRIFDPYLHFDSAEDKAAYQHREDEGRRYIAQQLAANTPQGVLNAGSGLADRMLDANAHGAGDSPDFLPRWQQLRSDLREQRKAVEAEGQSTEEYDRNTRASVRRFLKAKGIPESEIDAKLRATADPLDAVTPYLKSAKDADALKADLASAPSPTDPVSPPAVASTPDASKHPELDALGASLQVSGVTLTNPDRPDGHGLAATATATRSEGRTA